MQKAEIPLPQVIYGRIIYWLCIMAALVCTIGAVLCIAFPAENIINPHYLFASIWQGNDPEAVWEMGGGFLGGHFWMHNLEMWDGVIQLGLVIGCLSASLALWGAIVGFLRQRPRSRGWALLALFVSLLICLSASGIYKA